MRGVERTVDAARVSLDSLSRNSSIMMWRFERRNSRCGRAARLTNLINLIWISSYFDTKTLTLSDPQGSRQANS